MIVRSSLLPALRLTDRIILVGAGLALFGLLLHSGRAGPGPGNPPALSSTSFPLLMVWSGAAIITLHAMAHRVGWQQTAGALLAASFLFLMAGWFPGSMLPPKLALWNALALLSARAAAQYLLRARRGLRRYGLILAAGTVLLATPPLLGRGLALSSQSLHSSPQVAVNLLLIAAGVLLITPWCISKHPAPPEPSASPLLAWLFLSGAGWA